MSNPQTNPGSSTNPLLMNSRLYDRLKLTVLIILPALGSLYFGLSQIWGFPAGEEVVGSISLISVFFGTIVDQASSHFKQSGADGQLIVNEDPDAEEPYSLELHQDLLELAEKDQIMFGVKRI